MVSKVVEMIHFVVDVDGKNRCVGISLSHDGNVTINGFDNKKPWDLQSINNVLTEVLLEKKRREEGVVNINQIVKEIIKLRDALSDDPTWSDRLD